MHPILTLATFAAGLFTGHSLQKKDAQDKKTKKRVFYSYHYEDILRVQQIMQMGVIQGKSPVSPSKWENIKRKNHSLKKHIDNKIIWCSCVIVLIGIETKNRKWVKYEIEKAWRDGKGLFGIYINRLNCPNRRSSKKGANPFNINIDGQNLSKVIKCYDPDDNLNHETAYKYIKNNIECWTNQAVDDARRRAKAK